MQRLSRLHKPGWLTVARVWDALAVAVLVAAAWKVFVAPRVLHASDAQTAPRVVLATLAGPEFSLAKERGRVVFLDFFASWCEPCKASLPLVERYAQMHPQAIVIPVDVGEPRAIAAPFARAFHLKGVALDPEMLAAHWFGIDGFPTMVVIDPQGRIRATWPGLNPAIAFNMARAESSVR